MYVMVYMGSDGGGYYVPFAFAEKLLELPHDPALEEGYPSLSPEGTDRAELEGMTPGEALLSGFGFNMAGG